MEKCIKYVQLKVQVSFNINCSLKSNNIRDPLEIPILFMETELVYLQKSAPFIVVLIKINELQSPGNVPVFLQYFIFSILYIDLNASPFMFYFSFGNRIQSAVDKSSE